MVIDVIFLIVLLGAFYNGYSKGIIYSVLSLIAVFLGVIIAMNFSSFAAVWLTANFNIPPVIMPILSFILILVLVVVAIKLVAYITEKFLKAILLNFVNKLAGGILWSFIAALLFSVLMFLVSATGIFSEDLMASSKTYQYIILPFGPKALVLLQALIPFLKESFELLNTTVQEMAPPN